MITEEQWRSTWLKNLKFIITIITLLPLLIPLKTVQRLTDQKATQGDEENQEVTSNGIVISSIAFGKEIEEGVQFVFCKSLNNSHHV